MKRSFSGAFWVTAALAAGAFIAQAAEPTAGSDPIINASVEQKALDFNLPDGGLAPAPGVANIEVFRCSRADPQDTDGKGWTYNHHIDMAQWHGRMYIAWTNGEKDEDTWPAREVYSTSEDGFAWSKPAELFPQGTSTSLRMYFFHAPNGRMLAIAGLRVSTDPLKEETKRGLVVREILADHTLGPVCTLQPATQPAMVPQPKYQSSPDAEFVEACKQLLANHTFLETQDDGVLLGLQRMDAYDHAPASFGRAICFFERANHELVGISKKGFVTVSEDAGAHWTTPVHPASLITGNAKVWAQPTSDGKYVMVFNPHVTNRYPLVVTTSGDGVRFDNMRCVHGEMPQLRYAGKFKNPGPQYVRGISLWATDGSHIKGVGANDLWVGYSSNKEDIWVSRVPVDGSSQWNIYSIKWGGVREIDQNGTCDLEIEDNDPYDYAKATRLFPSAERVELSFDLTIQRADARNEFDIVLAQHADSSEPFAVALSKGVIHVKGSNHDFELGDYKSGDHLKLGITANAPKGLLSVNINGKATPEVSVNASTSSFTAAIFRTGSYREIDKSPPVDPTTDQPDKGWKLTIENLAIH